MEYRVRPLREGDFELVQDFDDFLALQVAEIIPITRNVLEKASVLRAKYGFLKTPDALHLAGAITARCDGFLTNDHRLNRCGDEIRIEVIGL